MAHYLTKEDIMQQRYVSSLMYLINAKNYFESFPCFFIPLERTNSSDAIEIKARKSRYLVRVGFGYLHANALTPLGLMEINTHKGTYVPLFTYITLASI